MAGEGPLVQSHLGEVILECLPVLTIELLGSSWAPGICRGWAAGNWTSDAHVTSTLLEIETVPLSESPKGELGTQGQSYSAVWPGQQRKPVCRREKDT